MDEQAIERIADKEPVRVDRITGEDVAAAAMLCFVDAQNTLHLAAEDWFPPYETEEFSAEIIKANAFWEVALSETQAETPYMESDKEWDLAVERRLMSLYKETKERYLAGEPARWVAGDVDGA